MPSAFIPSTRGYPAMRLAPQLEHQRCVPPSPLVLGRKPRKFPPPTADRDRPVSRRSKPSSRTTFIGEQPNPWELLHPQDVMSRHRTWSMISHGVDYIIILLRTLAILHSLGWKCKSRRIALDKSKAFPFGSVVTGSSSNAHRYLRINDQHLTVSKRDMNAALTRDFPRYCRLIALKLLLTGSPL